jgi:hypothetical protein
VPDVLRPFDKLRAQDEREGGIPFCKFKRPETPAPFVLSLSKDDLPNLQSRAFGPKADTTLRMQAAYDLAQARAREREIVVDRVAR